MPKTPTTRYDVAERFRAPEKMAANLEACLEEAHGNAAFSGERTPCFDIILKVIDVLGLKLHAKTAYG